MGGLLWWSEGELEAFSGAGKARHDGADGDVGRLCDLFVAEAFELAEDDDFAEFCGEIVDGCVKRLGIELRGEDGRGVGGGGVGNGGVVCERLERDVALVAGDEGEGSVADNLKQPGKSIAAAEGIEVFKSAHGGFLDNIVGVGIIAEDPARGCRPHPSAAGSHCRRGYDALAR